MNPAHNLSSAKEQKLQVLLQEGGAKQFFLEIVWQLSVKHFLMILVGYFLS